MDSQPTMKNEDRRSEDSGHDAVRFDLGMAGPPGPQGRLAEPVRGLVFEMRDVFYDDTIWRRWLLQVLRHLGLHTNYRSFYTVWDRDFLVDVHRGRREMCEAMQSFLLSIGLSHAQIDEVEAACLARRRQLENSARALPGVKSTLSRLHASGISLAVLSDSEHPAAALRQQLDRLGLAGLFAAVLSSLDLERTKPDPLCYQAAIEALRLPAGWLAFVGHDAEELAGATAIGMQTVAFNYLPEAEADVFITRFDELLDVVGPRTPYAAAG
jgi:HAD superfamily hydrolase (TIGR01509 family)